MIVASDGQDEEKAGYSCIARGSMNWYSTLESNLQHLLKLTLPYLLHPGTTTPRYSQQGCVHMVTMSPGSQEHFTSTR